MLCNVIHDINIQLPLNYVSRMVHIPSIEGTSGPDPRLITCTSLMELILSIINYTYLRSCVFIHVITHILNLLLLLTKYPLKIERIISLGL